MADFSLIKDQTGIIRGIWLKNPNEANDLYFLIMLTTRIANEEGQSFPQEYLTQTIAKQYRIVPNTHNNSGGCFVMFGDALAPDEQKKITQDYSEKNIIEQKITSFLYPIDRHLVEICSENEIISIKNYIKNIATASIVKRSLNLFTLTISGYDNDPRGLYEVPDVCVWARDTIQKIPYLIYFLDEASTNRFVGWLLGPISKTEAFSKEFGSKFTNKLTEVMVSSCFTASEYINSLGGDDKLFLLFSTQRGGKPSNKWWQFWK